MVPSESAETVVSGHRMALSVSPAQTVLWDQLQYTGDPAEFAWVLPVKGDPKVEVAASAFFEVLEANTAVTVTSPVLDCPQSGCCLSGDDSAAGDVQPGDPAVSVVHQGTVGPYETVTLAATDPDALASYLTQHGYAVDPSARATFDAYVAEGFGFVALRLQPGKDVRQMVPIRVRSEGANLTLPLRGISVGAGANVPIVLYVIGAGRYTTQNFPEAQLAWPLLSWDYKTSSSNYTSLREAALAEQDGRSFLTTYARGELLRADFAYSYFTQARDNGELGFNCAFPSFVENPKVVDACPDAEWGVGCPVGPGEADLHKLGCEGGSDLAIALVGMRPSEAFVTRLEANLPRAALDSDLVLRAADDQSEVSNTLTATIALNNEGLCPSMSANPAPPTRPLELVRQGVLWAGVAGLFAAWLRRRARAATRRCDAALRARAHGVD